MGLTQKEWGLCSSFSFSFSYSKWGYPRQIQFLLWKKNQEEAFNMEAKKGYDIEDVVEVIEMLSYSQGFYGRLLDEILYIEENEPDKYEVFKGFIEKQELKSPVDVVLFFEG
jgi:hypothetical protein